MRAETGWHLATLGLGGNIEDPQAAMCNGLQALANRPDCRLMAVSQLYRSSPWGKTDQNEFLNCCALLETTLSPLTLLSVCLDLERANHRVRVERWGPRTIDIDLLTYDQASIASETLTLPHPRMLERAFVLSPLREIAADMLVAGRRVDAWSEDVGEDGVSVFNRDPDWWRSRI